MGYSSSGSKKMLIKKYGARFNKGLKIINLRDILLLSFYLALVGIISFNLLEQNLYGKWRTSRTLFSVYSTITRMDLFFRGGLRSYLEEFTLANTLIYTELWKDYLPPGEIPKRLNISIWMENIVAEILNTTDILDLAAQEITYFKYSLSEAINNFKMNEYLADLSPDLREVVLKTRLDIVNYNGTQAQNALSSSRVSSTTFLGFFKVVLEQLERNLLVVQPELKGKKPKYNFNFTKVFDEFGIMTADTRFGGLRNAWAGTLDFYNQTLHTIKDLVIISEPLKADKTMINYQIICTILFFLFFLGSVYIGRDTNWFLVDLISQYNNLRSEEIELQIVVLKNRLLYFQRYRFDEISMLRSYFKHTYSAQTVDMSTYLRAGKKDIAKLNSQRRGQKVKSSLTFSSIKTLWIISVTAVSFLVYYVIVLDKTNASFTKINNMMTLYTNMYENITEAYHFYIYHSLYLVLGNYIKIKGRMPSDVIAQSGESVPIFNLIKFLTIRRTDIKALFDTGGSSKIDTMMYEDACAGMGKSMVGYSVYNRLCEENHHTSKGFLQYLYYQADMLGEYRSVFASNTSIIVRTNFTWVLFPFQTYMYSPKTYKFIIASKTVYDTVYDNILTSGEVAVSSELRLMENLIKYAINIPPPIFVIVFVILGFSAVVANLKKDLRLCGESLYNMLPEVISQNKVVSRKFGEAYSIKD